MVFSFVKIIIITVIGLSLISFNFVQANSSDDESDEKKYYSSNKNAAAINSLSTVAKKVGELTANQGTIIQGEHPPPPVPSPTWDNSNSYYPKFAYSKYMHPPPPPPPPSNGHGNPSDPHLQKTNWRNPRDPEYEDYYENKINSLKKQSNLGLGLGIGLGVGIPVLIILLLGIFIFYRYRKNRNNQGSRLSSIASVIMNPYSAHLDKNDRSPIHCSDLWAMDRQNVIIDYENKLGSGAFCNVHKGKIKGPAAVRAVCPTLIAVQRFTDCEVAIKLLPPFADDIARSDFAQEINFMKSLHYHPHLVSMLGYVPDARNPLLLVEYCAKGDLLHFIRSHRTEIEHGYENNAGIKIKNLVSFAWQISNGLDYLNSVGCIHRDVAARNVLLDEDNACKIADFGLCRLTDNLLYTARGGRLPLRWMAIESLKSFEYSFKTDVWAFGITLYELFSLGEVPYSTIDNQQLLDFLENGQRLARPIHCPQDMYDLMKDCWQTNPILRPSFSEICERLRVILEAAAPDYGYLVPIANTYHSTDSITAFRVDNV